MDTLTTTYDHPTFGGDAIAHDRSRELLGRVMGLVAVTVGFAALGAYLGRDLSGATGLVLFIGAFAGIFGLNVAVAHAAEQIAVGLRCSRSASLVEVVVSRRWMVDMRARSRFARPVAPVTTLVAHWSRGSAREFTGAKDALNAEAVLHGDDNDPAGRLSDRGRHPGPVCR